MKIALFFPFIFLGFTSNNFFSSRYPRLPVITDTSFTHIIDGKASEWPVQKFETDLPAEIKYAVDNDTQNLYLAVIIPGSRMQMKMMRNGMDIFVDLKGSKKESKGIEFPVKRDHTDDNSIMNYRDQKDSETTEQENPEQRKARMKAMKAAMVLNLSSIKVFGFAEDQSEEQGLKMPGSANVAFAWDSTDVMCIEYKIPFSLLGINSPSAQKDIDLGWKINGFQRSAGNSSASGSPRANRHGGGYGGGKRNFNGGGDGNTVNNSVKQDFENTMKDQRFWTKYTIR